MAPKTVVKLGVTLAALVAAGSLFAMHAARHPRSVSASASGGGHHVGERRRWALAFDVSLGQPGGGKPLDFELTGDWLAAVRATRDGEYDVAHEIAHPHVTGSGAGTPAAGEIADLERRLARRFWVTYRNDGAALRIQFPKDMDPTDRNLLQMIVTQTQLVRGTTAETHWTALERDGAGMYLAAYQTTPGLCTKRKLKYVEVDGTAGAATPDAVRVHLEQSEYRFSLDDGERVGAFEGTDRMRVGIPMGPGGWLDIRTAVKLTDARTEDPLPTRGVAEDDFPAVDSEPIRTHQPDPEVVALQRDRRLLEGQSADALLSAATDRAPDRALPSRLAALFRRQPDNVARALALVRARGGLATLTNAMASSGSPVGLEALGVLAHDASVAEAARIGALDALLLVQHPNAAAMRIALDLVDDAGPAIRRAARLVSGALARVGRSEHPTDAATLDDTLRSRFVAATGTQQRLDLLAALGNSVGPTLVPLIEESLRDSDPDIRAAAARALRLADASSVDDLLGSVMTSDGDPRVRSAAIFAADFRAFEPFESALRKAAVADPAESVRADAVRLLRKHRDESPEIALTLAEVAEHDPKPALRRLAGAEQ